MDLKENTFYYMYYAQKFVGIKVLSVLTKMYKERQLIITVFNL